MMPRALALVRRLPRLLHTSVPLRELDRTRRSQLLAKELTKARSISELVTMHRDYRAGIGHVHMPTLWHKLSVLSRRSEQRRWLQEHTPQLASLCDHTVELLPEIGTGGLASTASSLARTGLSGPPATAMWAALDAEAQAALGECGAKELSSVAWAFAMARRRAPDLLEALSAEAQLRLEEFNAQNLSDTAWAFAKARHSAPALFEALSMEVEGRLAEFGARELSSTAWAFATARHPAPALFEALGTQAQGRLVEFNAQELANTA